MRGSVLTVSVLLVLDSAGVWSSLPVVCWHGVNDNAQSCNGPFNTIKQTIPDVYTLAIMIGDNLDQDTANSVLMRADTQISKACEILQNDTNLAGGYNAIGISQGGLMFRGLLQRCPSPPVRNFITFGSPHQGVFGVPECKSTTGSPALCELVRRLLSEGAYIPWIQDLITPAQYWHNPLNNQEFLEGSHYLADINNERQEKNSEYKQNLEKLENFVMAKWLQDTTIIPGASAQFGFYLQGQDILTQDLQSLALYTEDWLGLRTLDQEGRLHFREMEGDHMNFNWDWFTEHIVIPFLV